MFILQGINEAMQKEKEEMSIGVLDIYGFEIFEVLFLSKTYFDFLIITYVIQCKTLTGQSWLERKLKKSQVFPPLAPSNHR